MFSKKKEPNIGKDYSIGFCNGQQYVQRVVDICEDGIILI